MGEHGTKEARTEESHIRLLKKGHDIMERNSGKENDKDGKGDQPGKDKSHYGFRR